MFVVGDIANYNDTKDPSYFDVAEDTLNLLHSSIEWFPIIGNHDIDYSDVCIFRNNIAFCQEFASQYNHLANSSLIQNWRTSGCANFSFDYYTGGSVARYIHFLCLDWVGHEICGDCAEKHSSTYNFYTDDLTNCNKSSHGIYLFAHHPCVLYRYPYELGFCNPLDRDAVTSWLRKYKRFIGKKWSWFNGHAHENASYSIFNGTTKVSNGLTTEACADYKPGEAKGIARLVEVYSDGHVETSLIYGQWPSSKVTFTDTTVYEDRNKSSSMQAIGAEK